ncbi:hypothetical protein IAE35_01210 [Pseudomonas sp. S75]|uniref:hypothetical protein n=1 Tax=unclassified Pseudomonas TaxID=196821 RepID=UPI001903BB2B|nr:MULTISPECIES: hypothetical protein [unclassified Pseudomonas]MBJ9974129.1 hypothetical protein [Pseudomonas sp. S30]MBK0151941.1 hypothetical protein [Pseudomonas sp. S75]
MDLQEDIATDPLPDEDTLIRTACDRHRISALIRRVDVEQLWIYAKVMAENKTSEQQLAAFVRDQIDHRDSAAEAAISAAYPGHSEDGAYRITLFVFGLLVDWSDVSSLLKAALLSGRAIVELTLLEASISVRIVQQTQVYEAVRQLRDASGTPGVLH